MTRRKIRYHHPNYPGQVRVGWIVTSGRDGHAVDHCDTGKREHVRHDDVLGELHGDDELPESVEEDIAKSISPLVNPDALKARAARYQDQYIVGHPARIHPDDLDWKLETNFPLDALPGSKDEWLKWKKETDASRNLEYADQPRHVQVLNPAIVVQGTDGQHYIWDGNRRVAEMYAAGKPSIPAIVGSPRNAHRPLPPGSAGRSGIRKSFAAYHGEGLPLILKATDAYQKIRQRSSAQQVMKRLQANAKAGQIGAGAFGRDNRTGGSKQRGGGKHARTEWEPAVVPRSRHQVGHEVHYQRHDMHEPAIGTIASVGKHGAIVAHHDGTKIKVRHEHILGSSLEGLPPDARQHAAEALKGKGAPIDPLEQYLLPERHQRPSAKTLERIKALIADGAPIDLERVSAAPEEDARKVIEHFAGPIDHDDDDTPVVRSKRQKDRLHDPWKERE